MDDTVTLGVKLKGFVRQETKRRWVAICPSIGVASQGDSVADAKRSLREAVELWFESCVERGVLDRALRESNFLPLTPDEDLDESREHVVVSRDAESDVRGDMFHIDVAIPAYQAAALLATNP